MFIVGGIEITKVEGDEVREVAGARSRASLGTNYYVMRALGSWRNLSRDHLCGLELIHYVALAGMGLGARWRSGCTTGPGKGRREERREGPLRGRMDRPQRWRLSRRS